MAEIRLGTSSFTATGWRGSFYPKGLRPGEYLSYYAQHFDTVEIDSTFCATPSVSVVRSWSAKTPEGFFFAAKVPQEIAHKGSLRRGFASAMGVLQLLWHGAGVRMATVTCDICGGIFSQSYLPSHKRLAHRQNSLTAVRPSTEEEAIQEIVSLYESLLVKGRKRVIRLLMAKCKEVQ